ncbi:unnamed protein product [Eruca vesicaria subsp. sativa]|uniref:F-box domain-containing protein n=1 Tax=Eruca vesicaria subsp. sativa TaxID=29727 RepID=A0ABC8IY84_ERUVS|nr:unnamed protein product [Eruca vesicaria subsp. sativa]
MSEQRPDIISSLPLELLLYIISFIPFESARLTPFVSTRFRFVWSQALVVAHSHNGSIEAISRFIHNFNEHDPSKNTRKMELHFDKSTFVSTILAPNNVMHMSFIFSDGSKREESFCWRIEINKQIPRRVESKGFLVKTLCLDSVYSLTHEVVSSMLLDFSLLESLKICDCKGLTSLTIDSPTKLLHLSISGCTKLRYLDIRSSKLKTLHYQGFLPSIKIHEHFNLTSAIFDVRRGPSYCNNAFDDIGHLLLIIKNSQSLTLCRWMFEELIRPIISSSWTSFQFYKLHELRWIDNSMKQENINPLISFLKLCPSIEHVFITIDSNTYSSNEELSVDSDHGSKHARVLKNLKLVVLEGSKNEEDTNQLILALQEIVNSDQPLRVLSS